MSSIVDAFTGKSQKEAGKAGARELEKGREAITAGAETARRDLFDLFSGGQQSRQAGLEGALDIFRTNLPAQAGAFQQGNVAAQQALLSGLPQIQNAILGRPVDFGALQQPTEIPFDFSFANTQLPTTPTIGAGGGGGTAPNQPNTGTPQLTPAELQALLSGGIRP